VSQRPRVSRGIDERREFTSKDGTVIGCHQSSSGPPLVLVHGTSADHTRWAVFTEMIIARELAHCGDPKGGAFVAFMTQRSKRPLGRSPPRAPSSRG
jgi:hypothetical protein